MIAGSGFPTPTVDETWRLVLGPWPSDFRLTDRVAQALQQGRYQTDPAWAQQLLDDAFSADFAEATSAT